MASGHTAAVSYDMLPEFVQNCKWPSCIVASSFFMSFITEQNAKTKVTAINSLTITVMTYCFDMVKWTLAEIKKIDTKIRKLITSHKMYQPKKQILNISMSREKMVEKD